MNGDVEKRNTSPFLLLGLKVSRASGMPDT